jgi:hypothetical protein
MILLTRASALLILILCVGEGAALAVGRLVYHDPFAPYEALMPGRPIAPASRMFHFDAQPEGDAPGTIRCVVNLDDPAFVSMTAPGTTRCVVNLDDPAFVSITATGTLDTFTQTVLHVTNLRVGDVVLRWGRPDSVTKYLYMFDLFWHDDGLSATIYPVGERERFNPGLPVEYLVISSGLPFPVPPSGQ